MKRILILMFFVAVNAQGQISRADVAEPETIGEIGAFGANMMKCEKLDNSYTFFYQDAKYTQLKEFKSFSFEDVDGAFDQLYETMMGGMDNVPDEPVAFNIGDDVVELDYVEMLGIVNVRLIHTDRAGVTGLSPWLTKKKVRKLFGKK